MSDINMVILGDIATWVTAIGTLGAFAVGFKQIHTERHERKKRTKDETAAKKRAHAEQLSGWMKEGKLYLSNSSHHPMHDVEIGLANGNEYALKVVAPGQSTVQVAKEDNDTHVQTLRFTDTHGERWVKRHGEGLANASAG